MRSARLALVGVLLTLGAVGPGAQQQQAAASLPVVIAGNWPQVNSIGVQANSSATVVARVTTDGGQVASVEVVRPAVLLTEDVVASIKTWKFEPHAPTSFETTFRFGRRTAEPRCYSTDRNAHLSSRLPVELSVESTWVIICDPSVTYGGLQSKIARGRVVCKCPDERPLAGVRVQLQPQGDSRTVAETVTNRDGWFDLGNVQPDKYRISISADGYHHSIQELLVSPGVHEEDVRVELTPDPTVIPPPPAATALPGALVTYPEAARRANIEGIVRMGMSTEGTVTVLDGPFELRETAVSNVRSWRFVEPPSRPFEIRYRYRLQAAACNADPSPAVTMRPPYDVEIVAKKLVPCGSEPEVVPTLLEAEWPNRRFYPQIAQQARIQGTVRLLVTTDGAAATNIEVVRPVPMMDRAAVDFVRSWRFAPHVPTTFETTVRFVLDPGLNCLNWPQAPAEFVVRPPADVVVRGLSDPLCNFTGRSENPNLPPMGRVRGVVRCDCPGGAPVPGAEVFTYDAPGGVSVMTDESGGFDLGVLPSRSYTINVDKLGFVRSSYQVTVARGATSHNFAVTLTPIPGYNVASLSAEPRPLISSAKIPTYPSAAREKGIEGVVRLQLHAGNRVTVVDGPEELSNAAVDNVRTWDVGVPDADRPLDIRFTYSLQAGDCAPDQNPTVTMRLPYEVKIAAKRFTKCGG